MIRTPAHKIVVAGPKWVKFIRLPSVLHKLLRFQHVLAEATAVQVIVCGLFVSHVGPNGGSTLLLIPVSQYPFLLYSWFLGGLSLVLLIVRVQWGELLISILSYSIRFEYCACWCSSGYCIGIMMIVAFRFFLGVWLNWTWGMHAGVPRVHIREVSLACDTWLSRVGDNFLWMLDRQVRL